MFRRLNKITVSMIAVAGVFNLVGCGSASNNDQGTSFAAIGFSVDGNAENGDAGSILPLFTDDSQIGVPGLNGTRAADGQFATTFLGLQNRLSDQFIRVVRIDCDYNVDGSFIEIPSDTSPGGLILGATGQSDLGVDVGILPDEPPSVNYNEFMVVSPDIYSFLNNNQALLPQLPFRMTATCSATGVTQSGDTLTTNSLNYFISFVEESECCTGDGSGLGFQTGPGSGGDLIVIQEEDTPLTEIGATAPIVDISE